MSLRLRFFAFDADEDPAEFARWSAEQLDRAAATDGAAVGRPVVHLAVLSAADADEDALGELCRLLEAATGFDFSTSARSVVPMDQLGSFADRVVQLAASIDDRPPGWFAALRGGVERCRAGYAHLAWELLWDQAGVSDGPDELPTEARVIAPSGTVEAIDAFLDVTDGEDSR